MPKRVTAKARRERLDKELDRIAKILEITPGRVRRLLSPISKINLTTDKTLGKLERFTSGSMADFVETMTHENRAEIGSGYEGLSGKRLSLRNTGHNS